MEVIFILLPLAIVMAGGALMGKAVALDEAPADVTVILALPAVAIRLALTEAVNWVALTNFEVSAVPFQLTVDPWTKPVPVTVRVNAAPPAAAAAGLSVVMVGGPLTGKVTAFDEAPSSIT